MPKSKQLTISKTATIAAAIGELSQGMPNIPFFTRGRWSMHELLLFLLSVTGPAKVCVSSFSLSEITVRTFASAMLSGQITSMELLLNTAVQRNKTDLLLFADNVVNRITLLHVHMKLILIENDNWKLIVNQSANSTVNPAWEAGTISTDPAIYERYRKEFEIACQSGAVRYQHTGH